MVVSNPCSPPTVFSAPIDLHEADSGPFLTTAEAKSHTMARLKKKKKKTADVRLLLSDVAPTGWKIELKKGENMLLLFRVQVAVCTIRPFVDEWVFVSPSCGHRDLERKLNVAAAAASFKDVFMHLALGEKWIETQLCSLSAAKSASEVVFKAGLVLPDVHFSVTEICFRDLFWNWTAVYFRETRCEV